MPDHTEDYEKFEALFRVKTQKVKELMESEKYKDAYLIHIDEDLSITPDNWAGGVISVTKQSGKSRKRSLNFIIMNYFQIVNIQRQKIGSSIWPSRDPKLIFEGGLEEFQDLDVVELIKKNLEDYIPIG